VTAKYGVRPVAAFREPEKRTLVEFVELPNSSRSNTLATLDLTRPVR